MMKRFSTILAASASLLVCAASSAVINGVEPDPGDTRFDAVAAFGHTDRLNGTVNEHNHFCNGTLITPTKMLMARHCIGSGFGPDNQPASGEFTFRFRRNPDGSLGTKAAGWESFHQVEVTHFTFSSDGVGAPDLLIAHLAEPVTHIEPIAVAPPGFLRAGMDVITAAWGTEADGSRGRLMMHTNVQTVQDPDSPTGMNDCSRVDLEETNGTTALYDSGGAFLVMSARIPYPYDYIDRDPQGGGPFGGGMRGGVAQPGGPLTPVPVEPKPVLVGVISSYGNVGARAHLHEVFEPVLACECFIPERVETPCNLNPYDLDEDYTISPDDLALGLNLWLGPCAQSGFPGGCHRLDDPDFGFGGNNNGELDDFELIAFYDSQYRDSYCACLEDVTGDGVVDATDVMQVMAAFGDCYCDVECIEDVNQDRVVDQLDLDLVLASVGPCDH